MTDLEVGGFVVLPAHEVGDPVHKARNMVAVERGVVESLDALVGADPTNESLAVLDSCFLCL
jgi:hypothetical protein